MRMALSVYFDKRALNKNRMIHIWYCKSRRALQNDASIELQIPTLKQPRASLQQMSKMAGSPW